jgi:hypothetical protein
MNSDATTLRKQAEKATTLAIKKLKLGKANIFGVQKFERLLLPNLN